MIQFSKKEQYLMFLGYMKAIDNISQITQNSADSRQIVMSTINSRVIEMIYPDGDFEDGNLGDIQKGMHDLRIDDRVIGIMQELAIQIPKDGKKYTKEDLFSTLLDGVEDLEK